MIRRFRIHLLWTIILLLGPGNAIALSTDRQKPIQIEADSAEFDNKAGTSKYSGNVKVTQGSMAVTADTITVYKKADGNLLVAEGGPVRFKQQPDGEQKNVVADAQRLEYATESDKLILTGNAHVEQAGNSFKSQRIVYDMAQNRVQAGSSSESSKQTDGKPKDRVHIVIQPKNSAPAQPETTSP